MLRMFTLLFALLVTAPISWAQSNNEFDRREAAVYEAWQQAPLTVRRAIFVSDHPEWYGMYTARPSNTFKPGEPLVAYAEPIGYGWKEISKDTYEFGFAVAGSGSTIVVGGDLRPSTARITRAVVEAVTASGSKKPFIPARWRKTAASFSSPPSGFKPKALRGC